MVEIISVYLVDECLKFQVTAAMKRQNQISLIQDKKIVKLHPDVHKELGELVEYKGETYNDIIRRLIRYYKQREQQKK